VSPLREAKREVYVGKEEIYCRRLGKKADEVYTRSFTGEDIN